MLDRTIESCSFIIMDSTFGAFTNQILKACICEEENISEQIDYITLSDFAKKSFKMILSKTVTADDVDNLEKWTQQYREFALDRRNTKQILNYIAGFVAAITEILLEAVRAKTIDSKKEQMRLSILGDKEKSQNVYKVLNLVKAKNGVLHNELASALDTTPQNLTNRINRWELGELLIQRRLGRNKMYFISPYGEHILEELKKTIVESSLNLSNEYSFGMDDLQAFYISAQQPTRYSDCGIMMRENPNIGRNDKEFDEEAA